MNGRFDQLMRVGVRVGTKNRNKNKIYFSTTNRIIIVIVSSVTLLNNWSSYKLMIL